MKFFITGDTSLDLKFITPSGAQCGNFIRNGQSLQQSFSIAENIFKLVERNTINFVLITLAPDALFRNADNSSQKDALGKNLLTLDNYITLCTKNGAKPVIVILPVAPTARENYREKFLGKFITILAALKKNRNFEVVNLFDLNLAANNFANETHLTEIGTLITSVSLTLKLRELQIFTYDDFCRMNYDYFYFLSQMTDKKFFHSMMDKIFSHTLSKIRRKDKIRVAFVTDNSAVWCGDKLYKLFADNPRFETTVFLCRGKESSVEDIQHDVTQFKIAGINVVGIFNLKEETPPQDIIFFLKPYFEHFSASFQFSVLTPQTLMAYIPYTINTASVFFHGYYDSSIFRLAWKYFFETELSRKLFDEKCSIGIPRGVVSGAPKMDFFFDDLSKVKFAWKMSRPDAKKIIWAPHHSFAKADATKISGTFPQNFQFMYEFAKAHPETSWVVKPHPRLQVSAIEAKIFPSNAAYEEYMRKWNELPNAQVFTGGYYQAIFATSDGMILDSISFIAEYQYTNKPMIFLLNNGFKRFTELGNKILDVSYIVDGKNHEEIATAIQKIFIKSNDTMKDKRLKVFDEYLNYRKFNGMSASEFIFKTVAEELEMI